MGLFRCEENKLSCLLCCSPRTLLWPDAWVLPTPNSSPTLQTQAGYPAIQSHLDPTQPAIYLQIPQVEGSVPQNGVHVRCQSPARSLVVVTYSSDGFCKSGVPGPVLRFSDPQGWLRELTTHVTTLLCRKGYANGYRWTAIWRDTYGGV